MNISITSLKLSDLENFNGILLNLSATPSLPVEILFELDALLSNLKQELLQEIEANTLLNKETLKSYNKIVKALYKNETFVQAKAKEHNLEEGLPTDWVMVLLDAPIIRKPKGL